MTLFSVYLFQDKTEKCPKYPIYPKYPCYIFAEIAVCAHRNVRIGGSGSGIGVVRVLHEQETGIT